MPFGVPRPGHGAALWPKAIAYLVVGLKASSSAGDSSGITAIHALAIHLDPTPSEPRRNPGGTGILGDISHPGAFRLPAVSKGHGPARQCLNRATPRGIQGRSAYMEPISPPPYSTLPA